MTLLARDRNDLLGLRPTCSRPSRLLSRDECLALNTVDRPRGRDRWHRVARLSDAQQRPRDAVVPPVGNPRRGRQAANYVEATSLIRGTTGNRHRRAVGARDRLDDELGQTSGARVVLNCTGPWAPRTLAKRWPQAIATVRSLPPSLDRHEHRDAPPTTGRLLMPGAGPAGERLLFMVAMGSSHTIIGTSHDPFTRTAQVTGSSRGNAWTAFLAKVGQAFPAAASWSELTRSVSSTADCSPL